MSETQPLSPAPTPPLTKKDFVTDQEVRWCPGCGDYAILNALQSVFPELGIPREKFVVVSGIGCSSRLPYYVNTFGFHSIHGRAPGIATGIKLANPELSVWIGTGDGDALSIGGNHLIHAMRRNLGVKILLFNNRIYGLTKGQYSPTSEIGKRTKSTPAGSADRPFNPISLALGASCTFVARGVDVFIPHLREVFLRAAKHQGTAYVEILQNCNIFNDGAWLHLTEKDIRDDQSIEIVHGKPLIFGKDRDKGLRRAGNALEIVSLGNGITEKDLLVHDETDPVVGFLLSRMQPPDFPTPIGVFHCEPDLLPYEVLCREQILAAREKKGPGDMEKVLKGPETWDIA